MSVHLQESEPSIYPLIYAEINKKWIGETTLFESYGKFFDYHNTVNL